MNKKILLVRITHLATNKKFNAVLWEQTQHPKNHTLSPTKLQFTPTNPLKNKRPKPKKSQT
ncbi:hypothetical protein MBO_01815 [Moraxella bovoculi 237]|uniref:Uncharacterized protein n=1 Tax=Moraxella bovoculi 237 TaxID=743974 RepID=A0A066UEP4_9GAMM|nr:hypothetical protein MBO_01815 [Moraxella bovoculi 237]